MDELYIINYGVFIRSVAWGFSAPEPLGNTSLILLLLLGMSVLQASLQSWRGQRPGFHPGSVPAQPCNLGLGNPPEVACPSGGGVPSAETLRCGQS